MKLDAKTTKLTEFSLDHDQIEILIREALCYRLFGTDNGTVPTGSTMDLRLEFSEWNRSNGYVTVKEKFDD